MLNRRSMSLGYARSCWFALAVGLASSWSNGAHADTGVGYRIMAHPERPFYEVRGEDWARIGSSVSSAKWEALDPDFRVDEEGRIRVPAYYQRNGTRFIGGRWQGRKVPQPRVPGTSGPARPRTKAR